MKATIEVRSTRAQCVKDINEQGMEDDRKISFLIEKDRDAVLYES